MAAEIESIKRRHKAKLAEYHVLKGREEAEIESAKQYKQEIEEAEGSFSLYNRVKALLTQAGAYARAQLVSSIEHTGTAGLQSILHDKDVTFAVDITAPGGRPSAEWLIQYGDNKVNPEDSDGGTVVDIVSLSLRCILLELSRPKPEGFFLLDEPGKMVSAEYLPHMAEFIKKYLQRTGRQGIMITHHDILADAAHRAYRIDQVAGVSQAKLREEVPQ